jgi:hypothetical protein
LRQAAVGANQIDESAEGLIVMSFDLDDHAARSVEYDSGQAGAVGQLFDERPEANSLDNPLE